MWLNMLDGTDCCSLCSSRSNNWGLFSVQPPRIQQHPELHIFLRDSQKTRKRLLTLQMLQLAASRKKKTIPCKTNKCILHEKDAMLHYHTRTAKIILKTVRFYKRFSISSARWIPRVQQADLLLSLPYYDIDAFLWFLRIIIVATFYLWNKAITPDT